MVSPVIHVRKAGYLLAELIRDGRQIDGQGLSQQRKTRRIIRVGVDDAADMRAVLVDVKVVGQVHGGIPCALQLPALEVGGDHILRLHPVVIHAAGLDNHHPALPINSTRVSAVHGYEPRAIYSQISFPDFLTQFFHR
jgi:hypothetical protein